MFLSNPPLENQNEVSFVGITQYAKKNFLQNFCLFSKMKLFIVKRLTMAKRLYRELTDATKSKISNSMKNFHRNQNIDDKRQTNNKKSISMQRYWSAIRHKPTGITSNTTIEDIML